MTGPNRQGKLQNCLNYRMRAILNDGRQLSGQMLAFDKHMNIVFADAEEFRLIKRKNKGADGAPMGDIEEKRTLGLCIIRGMNVVSMSVDGPPPTDPASRLGPGVGGIIRALPGGAAVAAGPGISKPIGSGRGLPIGLTGPAPLRGPPGSFHVPSVPSYPPPPPAGFVGRGMPPPPIPGVPGFPPPPPPGSFAAPPGAPNAPGAIYPPPGVGPLGFPHPAPLAGPGMNPPPPPPPPAPHGR